jgi:hypothetical protein
MKKFSDFLEGRCWPGYKAVPGKEPYSPGSCKKEDVSEEWSQKYKSSINCSHPKGFSQKAHCAGKKKHNESVEIESVCPDCGMCKTHGTIQEASAAAIAAATAIAKQKSGDYDSEGMRKTPYKNPDSPNRKSNAERRAELKEDLRKWFSKTDPKGDWKRINSKGEAIGPCAREPGEPKPKCMSQAQRNSLSKKERASAVRRKRQQDPDAERQGAPINVKSKVNENMEQLDEKNKPTNPELWSRAIAQAKSKFDVYPSAYANGWASKWYKEHGGGWKSVSEAAEVGDDPVNQGTPDGLSRRGNKTMLKKFKDLAMEGAVPSTEKVVTVRHKTSGKELRVAQHALASYKVGGYHPVSQVKEAKDEKEYGYEGDMALNQLKTLVRCAEMIEEMLKPDTDLPEWVQSKITLATDYIQTAADYMYSEMKEEVQIDELSSDLLGRYKTAAGADASKADKAGDYDKGNKRFSGIMKATKKQFANDMKKEEVEQIDEARPSQRHPLEGHEYHKKSNEALVHIAKDAHAAAEAMKGHNTDAENKYRDQANDSATVRHYRKTNGMPEWYKKKYGHVNEATEKKTDNSIPFDGPYKKTPTVVTDKSGAKHGPMSRARDLARNAAKRQAGNMKTEEKEKSRKAQIVKNASKNKDKFEKDPIITDTTVKTDNLQ